LLFGEKHGKNKNAFFAGLANCMGGMQVAIFSKRRASGFLEKSKKFAGIKTAWLFPTTTKQHQPLNP